MCHKNIHKTGRQAGGLLLLFLLLSGSLSIIITILLLLLVFVMIIIIIYCYWITTIILMIFMISIMAIASCKVSATICVMMFCTILNFAADLFKITVCSLVLLIRVVCREWVSSSFLVSSLCPFVLPHLPPCGRWLRAAHCVTWQTLLDFFWRVAKWENMCHNSCRPRHRRTRTVARNADPPQARRWHADATSEFCKVFTPVQPRSTPQFAWHCAAGTARAATIPAFVPF